MLVIDENKLKLLKMKEKLLEVTEGNQEAALDDYKKLAIEIDNEMYEAIINKIKNTNYHNLPLEEQLKFLTDIEKDYESFNEFQCEFRNVVEKYTDSEFDLSDIGNILIDVIRNRISIISGYLINIKNIERNKEKLEKLNTQLITEEKKKEAIEEKLIQLDDELINNMLNAEGRLIDETW